MVSHDNIEFRKNYTPHMLMPQNLKSEIVADIKNKATQIASNDKGTDLNNKSLENKNLKNEVNPVIAVNNSERTTKIGNKSEPKILVAKNKPDLPIFMQESIQFR
jgi:hypothetical protein